MQKSGACSHKEMSREAVMRRAYAQRLIINIHETRKSVHFQRVLLFLRAVKLYRLSCRAVPNQWTGLAEA